MATTYKCNEFNNVNTMTPTQVKKHITQMNKLEKDLVKQVVAKIDVNRIIISPHLIEKMEGGVTFGIDIIKDTIKNFKLEEDLIEVNYNKDKSTRIAFKGHKVVNVNVNGRITKCKMAFVYNLKNRHLVTIWYNDLVAIKRIPNLNRYDRTLNVAKCLKPYIN